MQQIFEKVWNYIRINGELVSKAQSAYGADRWRILDGDEWHQSTLEDDGYTHGIFSPSIRVRQTTGRPFEFEKGTEKEMQELHDRLIGGGAVTVYDAEGKPLSVGDVRYRKLKDGTRERLVVVDFDGLIPDAGMLPLEKHYTVVCDKRDCLNTELYS